MILIIKFSCFYNWFTFQLFSFEVNKLDCVCECRYGTRLAIWMKKVSNWIIAIWTEKEWPHGSDSHNRFDNICTHKGKLCEWNYVFECKKCRPHLKMGKVKYKRENIWNKQKNMTTTTSNTHVLFQFDSNKMKR